MAAFTHIIAFKYKSDASEEEIKDFEQAFLAFNTDCVGEDGKPYLTVRGGKQVFPHPPAHSMDTVFIVDFKSKEDEQYFHKKDPVHGAFIGRAQAISNDAVILDFFHFEQNST